MRAGGFLQFSVFSCALWSAAAFGQPAQPVFEAASVRRAAADTRVRPKLQGGPGTADEGQITYTNVTLASVLLRAYDVKSYQVSGPDWLGSERYDIAAKIPPGTTKEQFGVMLQGLLAERFHVVLHHETREIPGFELVTGKNGAKLKASADAEGSAPTNQASPASPPKRDAQGFPILDSPGMAMMEGVRGKAVVSFLTARGQPVSALVDVLSREFRLPILDKTGLMGRFDYTLEFAPQPPGALPAPTDGSDAVDESAPNLITAVQQQLGLKLNSSKVPLDVLVADRADRVPTAN